jgi:hypothetical protein
MSPVKEQPTDGEPEKAPYRLGTTQGATDEWISVEGFSTWLF